MLTSNTATVEIVQESTTPSIASRSSSQIDKLAETGDVNMLVINALNESSDSIFGSKSSSCNTFETQKFMTVIEENTEMTENDQNLSLSQDLTNKIKEASRMSADKDEDSDESDDETFDKIEVGADDAGIDLVEEKNNEEEMSEEEEAEGEAVDEIKSFHDEADESKGDEVIYENLKKNEEGIYENLRQSDEQFADIQDMITEEMGYYDNVDKSVEEEPEEKEQSMKEETEKSLSEGKGERKAELKVLDRSSAPKVIVDYEPSTTEAESGMSDTDTLDTESLHEDFVNMVKQKKGKKGLMRQELLKVVAVSGSLSSDKEVAIAMCVESPSTIEKVPGPHGGIMCGSTEPITQDTLGDGESLMDEEESEVIMCDVSLHQQTQCFTFIKNVVSSQTTNSTLIFSTSDHS